MGVVGTSVPALPSDVDLAQPLPPQVPGAADLPVVRGRGPLRLLPIYAETNAKLQRHAMAMGPVELPGTLS